LVSFRSKEFRTSPTRARLIAGGRYGADDPRFEALASKISAPKGN
jgi:hypothetical protein